MPPTPLMDTTHWPQHLETACYQCYGPAFYIFYLFTHNMLLLFLYCIFHIYADSEPEDTEITQPTDQYLQLHDEGTKLKYIVHASSIVG